MAKNYQFMIYGDPKKIPWFDELPNKEEKISKFHWSQFYKVMFERQEIWYKRFIKKQKAPWTKDKFLKEYKFTNVYRELDRASQWLINNVLTDHSLSDEDLIWKIISFRFFNQPNTFDKGGVELQGYKEFDSMKMWEQVVSWREKGNNPWHVAYMMNLAFLRKPKDWCKRGLFKDEAYILHAYEKYHAAIPRILSIMRSADSPLDIIKELEKLPAVSTFQSHEFYIDFCYIAKYWKKPLMEFNQNDYTNVGPGCSLGLRLLFPSLSPKNQIKGIYLLRDSAEAQLKKIGKFKYLKWSEDGYGVQKKSNITLHQIEMWLCEYSKYWKMSIKQGKQRSKFKPQTKVSQV